MASKQFLRQLCDLCGQDALHLYNLPCLKHRACHECSAQSACTGPTTPVKYLHSCSICVTTPDKDIEPYTEDFDPSGIGLTGELDNPRTNTPADLVLRQQSPNSQKTFVQLASTRLLNRPVDTRPKLLLGGATGRHPSRVEKHEEKYGEIDRPNEDAKPYGHYFYPKSCDKSRNNPSPHWAASKSDSLDSLGSWRSSPGVLTQGDIRDMGILALPQRPTIGSYTQGVVVATEGILSPRSFLKAQHEIHRKQRQLERDQGSSFLELQSDSPTHIALDVNVLDPDDKSRADDDSLAARYLFESKTPEDKKEEESKLVGHPRKKSLRGMAGPIISGAVQKPGYPIRSIVAAAKNKNDDSSQDVRQQCNKQLVFTNDSKQPNEGDKNADLTGLNDEIEQLLKDASKPSNSSSTNVPATVILRQLSSSTLQKPVKRNAKGQQIPALMSRYSALEDNIIESKILKKPTPNVPSLALPSNKTKPKVPAFRPGWSVFPDVDDDFNTVINSPKVTFVEDQKGNTKTGNVWTQRRQDTPFPTAGMPSEEEEEEEEEIERCTSPVKRVRGAMRRRWVDPSPSNSEDSQDRSSMTTNLNTITDKPEVEDYWEV